MSPVTRSAVRSPRFWLLALALAVSSTLPAAAAESKKTIADGLQVSIEYTLSAKGEGVIDSNVGKDPLKYIQGKQQIVPSLENALVGLSVGDTKKVDIVAKDAFGDYDDTRRITVEKSQLPADAKAGQMLMTGEGVPVKVLEIKDDKAVIDVNHPLAGKDISFDVKILAIDDAPAEAAAAAEPAAGTDAP
jgi:FKBP-type peptidyl-prolyl cis-trans isomerase 2